MLIILLLFSSTGLWSQTIIESSVIANGGATISNQTNRIVGTVGQSLVGRSNNQTNIVKGGFWEQAVKLITSVEVIDGKVLPTEFHLFQNYPNPFNPTTKIQYSIPNSSNVVLKIYDVLGKEVATLVDEYKSARSYEVEFYADGIASGVYFYKLQASSFGSIKKMILLR